MTLNYKSVRIFHCCIVLTLGYTSVLYIDSYTSPIENQLLRDNIFTEDTYPVFVAVAFVCAGIFSIFVGTLGEQLGCKTCLIIFSPLGFIGSFFLVLVHDSSSMIIGKAMVGAYQGVLTTLIPVYIAEVARVKKFDGRKKGRI